MQQVQRIAVKHGFLLYISILTIMSLLLSACHSSSTNSSPTNSSPTSEQNNQKAEKVLFDDTDLSNASVVRVSSSKEITGIDLNNSIENIDLPFDSNEDLSQANELNTTKVLSNGEGYLVVIRKSGSTYEIRLHNQSNNSDRTTVYAGLNEVQSVAVSEDGNLILASISNVFNIADNTFEVYLFDLANTTVNNLSNTVGLNEINVSMSRKGTRFVWQGENVANKQKPYICDFNGTSCANTILNLGVSQVEPSISATGLYIALVRLHNNGNNSVRLYDVIANTYTSIKSSPVTVRIFSHPSVDGKGENIMFLEKRLSNNKYFVRITNISTIPKTTSTEISTLKIIDHPFITGNALFMAYSIDLSPNDKTYTRDITTNVKAVPEGGTFDYFGAYWMIPVATFVSSNPVVNDLDAAVNSDVEITFTGSVTGADDTNFIIHREFKGKQLNVDGTYSGNASTTLSFDPTNDFSPGEVVDVSLTSGISSIDPFVYQFRTGVENAGSGVFQDASQTLGNSNGIGIDLGDLDGDGDLDAFVANTSGQGNKIWLNDGSGIFSDSHQSLGNSSSNGIDLGDLDGDGDLDAFVVNINSQPSKVWLNDGSGSFSDSNQSLGNPNSDGIDLGDLDGDGDLDAFVIGNFGVNQVWLNDGSGSFSNSNQSLGSGSKEVDLGDLDGDGDLDAFVANNGQGNEVWLNDGSGNFSNSNQSLGNSFSQDIDLGDLDGDGDLDAFVVNFNVRKVWLNDGSGIFSDSNQSLGNSTARGIDLGDLDGDGDLDAFEANSPANKVWLNDGSGSFNDSNQSLGNSNGFGIDLGDLDGDGDLDAFVINFGQANKVWLNTPPSP